MDGSTFIVLYYLSEPRTAFKPMQYREQMNRIMVDVLFEKKPVEPSKPEKPYIDERPHQPKEGQQILTDSKNR